VHDRLEDLREPHRCERLEGMPAKASYRSHAKAQRAVRLIASAGGPRFYAYQCTRCNLWHLSKQRPWNRA